MNCSAHPMLDKSGNMPYIIEARRSAMPRPVSEVETARLEARVHVNVYEQMQRAARLRGLTLTGYLIAPAGEDDRRTVQECAVLRLAAQAQVAFALAQLNSPAPTPPPARVGTPTPP